MEIILVCYAGFLRIDELLKTKKGYRAHRSLGIAYSTDFTKPILGETERYTLHGLRAGGASDAASSGIWPSNIQTRTLENAEIPKQLYPRFSRYETRNNQISWNLSSTRTLLFNSLQQLPYTSLAFYSKWPHFSPGYPVRGVVFSRVPPSYE